MDFAFYLVGWLDFSEVGNGKYITIYCRESRKAYIYICM